MSDTLDATTVLVRTPDLQIRLDDRDRIEIDIAGTTIAAPPMALRILDIFSEPRTIEGALEVFAAVGPEHYMEASRTILQLARARVLRTKGDRRGSAAQGYVRPAIHIAMLDDLPRTIGFCNALRKVVRDGDIVIEIGVGTGVLSTCAAQTGALRVYGIEASGIAELAEQVIAKNRVTNQVSLVHGRSTHVNLPEKGNVLVTEMIGNDPLDEDLLEVIADAKRRLLVPDARIIPADIEVWAIPVDVPVDVFEDHAFTPSHLDTWYRAYGIDFSTLATHRLSSTQPLMIKSSAARTWTQVAPPIRLARLDFQKSFETVLESDHRFVTAAPATHLGILLAFRSTLAEGIVLSTLPEEVDPTNHWRLGLWPVFNPAPVPAGAERHLVYAYARGETSIEVH